MMMIIMGRYVPFLRVWCTMHSNAGKKKGKPRHANAQTEESTAHQDRMKARVVSPNRCSGTLCSALPPIIRGSYR